MNTPKSLFFLFAAIALSLGSCGAPNNVSTSNSLNPSPASQSPAPTATAREAEAPTARSFSTSEDTTTAAVPAANMVTVTIYTADSQCAQLVPEQVQVPANEAMQAAVGQVLAEEGSSDLKLAGYRVSVGENGVATVDFRLAADSQRQFTSLSTCENLALMGGVRETLTQNPEWQIESVRFTERGEEILM